MLEVSLRAVSNFALRDVSLTFAPGSLTAVAGAPASGASTLLRLIAGAMKPAAGEIVFGTRVVNDLRASRRPLLFVTSDIDAPARWSVRHVMVAAVRHRTLDRVDRQHEYNLAVEKWQIGAIVDRSLRALSHSERTMVNLARIELMRPGVLIADRLLERLNPAALSDVIEKFYRTIRVAGTTLIGAPSSAEELASFDGVVVLSNGRVVQQGTVSAVYGQPADEAAARATGEVNVVPVTIAGSLVESVIGGWEVSTPPFQGTGVALIRPDSFAVAEGGAESDVIVAVEEASFDRGRWMIRAMLSGGITLRIALPSALRIHKGKLLALTYDASRFTLIRREMQAPSRSVPGDAVPSMKDSR